VEIVGCTNDSDYSLDELLDLLQQGPDDTHCAHTQAQTQGELQACCHLYLLLSSDTPSYLVTQAPLIADAANIPA